MHISYWSKFSFDSVPLSVSDIRCNVFVVVLAVAVDVAAAAAAVIVVIVIVAAAAFCLIFSGADDREGADAAVGIRPSKKIPPVMQVRGAQLPPPRGHLPLLRLPRRVRPDPGPGPRAHQGHPAHGAELELGLHQPEDIKGHVPWGVRRRDGQEAVRQDRRGHPAEGARGEVRVGKLPGIRHSCVSKFNDFSGENVRFNYFHT